MMKFTIAKIKALIAEAANEEAATGDDWLDNVYDNVVPSIIGHTSPYYGLFYILADTLKPGLVVELGSWRGYAAAHFAVGNPNGEVVTIDIHKDDQVAHKIAQEIAQRYDNLDFIHAWTWDASERVAEYGPIDILFIDSWHHYEHIMREWALYEPLLAPNALVIVDDIFDADGTTINMVQAWKEISKGSQAFIDTSVHSHIPMGFMKYIRSSKSQGKKQPAKKK